MKSTELKEHCRIFYMMKGHLNTSLETIVKSSPGYFKRLWYNEEAYIHETDFQKHYNLFKKRYEEQLGDDIAKHFLKRIWKNVK